MAVKLGMCTSCDQRPNCSAVKMTEAAGREVCSVAKEFRTELAVKRHRLALLRKDRPGRWDAPGRRGIGCRMKWLHTSNLSFGSAGRSTLQRAC